MHPSSSGSRSAGSASMLRGGEVGLDGGPHPDTFSAVIHRRGLEQSPRIARASPRRINSECTARVRRAEFIEGSDGHFRRCRSGERERRPPRHRDRGPAAPDRTA